MSVRVLLRVAAFLAALLPAVAAAEPVKLKLAFFSSDRTHLYRSIVKPFVDAVNAEGKGKVEIEVYLSGKLGADVTKQSRLVLDGAADIVYVVQPYERVAFPDSGVIELPGLYRDGREGTIAFSRLVEQGAMRGFRDFFVIGTVASEPESIHARPQIAALADLKGKRIRANNEAETAVMQKLGMVPVFVPINETAEAISSGKIDGAYVPPVPMVEFGIGRVASNHYMLATSCVPLSLLMSRKKFDSLPAGVQAIIKRYSGDWLIHQYNSINEASTALIMGQLEGDSKRHVVFPSKADAKVIDAAYRAVVDDYVAKSADNAKLVAAARAEVDKLRESD